MRVSFLAVLISGVLVAGLAGCVRAPVFVPGQLVSAVDAHGLCSALNARREKVAAFRTLVDATVAGPGDEVTSFRYAIVGKANEKLRIDVLPQEGAYTLALITVRGSDALLLDTQAKHALEGCSVSDVLERFLGFQGMTPAVVQGLVLGQTPHLACSDITVHRPDAGRMLFLDRRAQLAWEVDEASGELMRVHVLDYANATVTAVAKRERGTGAGAIDLTIHKPVEATAEMRIIKLTRNPEVSDKVFEVPVPAGYEREQCSRN